MTIERFNELLRGPLAHPLPIFTISRLALALKAVVDATGEAGEKALIEYCDARQERDDLVDEEVQDGTDYEGPNLGPEETA